MYSDISTRINASSLPNTASARAFDNSVLPTPVGPRNKNEPTGRFGSFKPTRLLLIALATASTASFWPTTLLYNSSSRRSRRLDSCSVSLFTGIFVHTDTTSAISSASTTTLFAFLFCFILSSFVSSFLCFFNSSAASSISPASKRFSISSENACISSSNGSVFFAFFPNPRRFLEQASSIRSIALSGRKRSLIYRTDNDTAASSAWSLISTWWCSSYAERSPFKISTVSSLVGSST